MNAARKKSTATTPAPRISIGLPVRNGSRYLEAAVQSILGQTCEDFELIIRDNASTDDSVDIARSLAQSDDRIRFESSAANEGAAANFNAVFRLARGEYFKWTAHDDLLRPTFVEACLDYLDANPQAVLCHAQTERIDEEGNVTGHYGDELELVQSDPCRRFGEFIHSRHACFSIFGLIRTRTLARTPLIGAWLGSDRNLLAELALIGKLRLLEETLYQRRDHPDASIRKHTGERERLTWFDPRPAPDALTPTIKRVREYEASIHRVALSERDRACCLGKLAAWCREGRLHTGEAVAEKIRSERAAIRDKPSRQPAKAGEQRDMTP